jgi:hypothetical protein
LRSGAGLIRHAGLPLAFAEPPGSLLAPEDGPGFAFSPASISCRTASESVFYLMLLSFSDDDLVAIGQAPQP